MSRSEYNSTGYRPFLAETFPIGSTPSFTDALRTSRTRKETGWTDYGRGIAVYDGYFAEVLGGKRIKDLVIAKEEPLVVDIMAPSGTLADLFRQLPQPNKRGIAVSYEDLRTDDEKERDASLNIEQIPADITRGDDWKKVNTTLGGRKADLIMQRPMGGMDHIPNHKDYYAYEISQMWDMLSDQEGTLLVQLPAIEKLESVDIYVSEWVKGLNNNGIEAESYSLENLVSNAFLDKWPLSRKIPGSALRIVKRPDSLKVLPDPEVPAA